MSPYRLTLLLCLAATPALAQQLHAMPGMDAKSPVTPAGTAMMDGMETMNKAMADAPVTGDPDHDFVAMMVPHHQGAIDMARVELRYGKDPALRRLARGIVAAQDREIAAMHRWQSAHPR